MEVSYNELLRELSLARLVKDEERIRNLTETIELWKFAKNVEA